MSVFFIELAVRRDLKRRNELRVALAAGALALAGCGGGTAGEIVVLHTADGYGYFDDCGCRADSTGGLAKRAWVVDSLRRMTDTPILLVDAGDFTGGDNAYGAALGRVMMDAMELMGYDAYTLGEWDFNQGTAYLRGIVTESPIPWVHTNYDVVGLEGLGEETLVVERGGRRIGLLGLYNPTILLDPAMRDSIVVEDIVESAERGVASLRAQGVDAIVALSHLSYKGNRALAEYVGGIDLIVSGHGGKVLTAPEPLAPGTWVAAAGDLGRYLGSARLEFGGADRAEVTEVTGQLIAMEPALPNDPRLTPLFARYEEERKTLIRRELGAQRPAGAEETRQLEESGSGRLRNPGS
ncbi:MAG TPA: metallophosphoesterase [Gemmatimonadota bacterium]|nr:metallophosphoesterase [Gemmatimonadota bacterium]